MPVPRFHPNRFLMAFALAAAAVPLPAQLASSSPFLPAAAAGAPVATEGAAIELRGVMETGDGLSFCIFDPARKVSVWSRVNEKDHDFLVKAYDPASETLTVEHGGRTLRLVMRTVKVASSGQAVAPLPLPAPGMPPAQNAVTQSVVLQPTPADEQRRLDAVAAEVRRRRALREQASILAAQGVQPVVETPPAQPAQPQRKNQQQGQTRNRQRN
jgi:hypothetical protein